ncbi:MAG: menaquinone biosynthesis protein [Acidobacteria bacterium]|nr:menaquinone biosynthesis protein [Acidobacteriota bacterium]
MRPIRLGAVEYLNARPLVRGLDRQPDRFDLRFDLPAELLGHDYRIVPGVGVVSRGPVASVALFSTKPVSAIRSIAIDSSSRASVALLKILCVQRFGIDPAVVPLPPDLPAMIGRCDAALIIGDVALFADHEAAGARKIDLGEEWTEMTGLPFVYACWAGRPSALQESDVAALQAARDRGVRELDAVAREHSGDDEARIAAASQYLRANVQYDVGAAELAGLRRFLETASELGIAPGPATVDFYQQPGPRGAGL